MSKFFKELKQRKVIQAGGVYIVSAWVIIQVMDVLFEALELPNWVLLTVFIILFAGFPIVLIIAWIFERNPEGKLVRDTRGQEEKDPSDTNPVTSKSIHEKSIAVLPFSSFTKSEDDVSFADGIHDDILTQLSKIHELKVVSRTSVMEYQGTTKNIKQIANELGVAHIIEGSVRRVGDRVRIVSQLIKAETDEHLLAETYDRDYSDIFAIQTDVAKKIASAMKATLTPEEIKQIEKIPTENVEAYDYFLKGKYYWENHFDFKGNLKAADLFEKAIELDPNFIQALALAVVSHSVLFNNLEWDPTAERKMLAKKRLDMAMLLSPDNPIILHANAMYLSWVENNIEMSKAYLKKTIELMPNHVEAIRELAQIEAVSGNFDEANRLHNEILRIDPSKSQVNLDIGNAYFRMRDIDNAQKYYEIALEANSEQSLGYAVLTLIMDAKHQSFEQGDKVLEKGFLLVKNPTEQLYICQNLHARMKKDRSAALASAENLTGNNKIYVQPALTYEIFGMKEEARVEWDRLKTVIEKRVKDIKKVETLFNYGYVLICSGEPEKGYPILQDAYNNWSPYTLYSWTYLNFIVFYADALARMEKFGEATKIVKMILERPHYYTKWHFRVDPLFDKLRDHQEFLDLIAED